MMGHRVRIAQRGWAGDRAAETLDEVTAGVRLPWVEIDGHRFDGIVSATFDAGQGEFTTPVLRLEVIGPVEVVYLGAHGEPLGSIEATVDALVDAGTFDAGTFLDRAAIESPS